MSGFVKISTILDQTRKLSQVISMASSLDAESVQVPLQRNVVPQAFEYIQKEEGEYRGSQI